MRPTCATTSPVHYENVVTRAGRSGCSGTRSPRTRRCRPTGASLQEVGEETDVEGDWSRRCVGELRARLADHVAETDWTVRTVVPSTARALVEIVLDEGRIDEAWAAVPGSYGHIHSAGFRNLIPARAATRPDAELSHSPSSQSNQPDHTREEHECSASDEEGPEWGGALGWFFKHERLIGWIPGAACTATAADMGTNLDKRPGPAFVYPFDFE